MLENVTKCLVLMQHCNILPCSQSHICPKIISHNFRWVDVVSKVPGLSVKWEVLIWRYTVWRTNISTGRQFLASLPTRLRFITSCHCHSEPRKGKIAIQSQEKAIDLSDAHIFSKIFEHTSVVNCCYCMFVVFVHLSLWGFAPSHNASDHNLMACAWNCLPWWSLNGMAI